MPVHAALVLAARHGLPSDLAPALPTARVAARELDSISVACRTDRISGLLAAAVAAGEVSLPGDAFGHSLLINDDWHRALLASVQIEALLVRSARRLHCAGVRWAVTKGSAVAHLDFPDPALRCFADIDLVIHPEDWVDALETFSARDPHRPHLLQFTERYGKGQTVMVDDMEVDLHRRFAVGRFGVRCNMADAFDHLDSFALADQVLPALAPELRLLHACFHAVLGGNRGLRAYRDVAQIATSHPDSVAATWTLAAQWNVQAVVAHAVLETWRLLRLQPDHQLPAVARTVCVNRRDRTVIGEFQREVRYRRQVLTSLGSLPWSEWPRFLGAAWSMSREARR